MLFFLAVFAYIFAIVIHLEENNHDAVIKGYKVKMFFYENFVLFVNYSKSVDFITYSV